LTELENFKVWSGRPEPAVDSRTGDDARAGAAVALARAEALRGAVAADAAAARGPEQATAARRHFGRAATALRDARAALAARGPLRGALRGRVASATADVRLLAALSVAADVRVAPKHGLGAVLKLRPPIAPPRDDALTTHGVAAALLLGAASTASDAAAALAVAPADEADDARALRLRALQGAHATQAAARVAPRPRRFAFA
jgi:hypothetical protein